MKKIIMALTTLVALLLASCDRAGLESETTGTGGQIINLIVPEKLPETRVTWDTPDAFGQWEDGDKLYISGVCKDKQDAAIADSDFNIIGLRTGGQWVFSNTLIVPSDATSVLINAYYVVESNDPSINTMILQSTENYEPNSNIVLNAFQFTSICITFTGLEPGNQVSFKPHNEDGWYINSIHYDGSIIPLNIPTITAEANGTAMLYAVPGNNTKFSFRINGKPADADKWYTFDTGPVPDGKTNHIGMHFKINCGSGTSDIGDLIENPVPEELKPFLAWAKRCRAITEGNIEENFTLTGNIDLTGITWEPIGLSTKNSYSGTFDGAGFTISGLKVDTDKDYAGLFGIMNGTVKNLTISEANIKGEKYTGSFAGEVGGHIIACRAKDCTLKSNDRAGGITASLYGTIIACHTIGGHIIGNLDAGGITSYSNRNVIACVAEPRIMTADETGGLVSLSYAGTTTASYWRKYDTTGNGDKGGIGIANEYNSITTGCDELTTVGSIDATAVTAMNAAIDTYNTNNRQSHRKCDYEWTTDGLKKK